mmetsp:Transcript_32801/g.103747  ORF Transcript_32801/g.103747 Transcript_32801/m.103747 type:complete len:879 (-) Transcript_32801:86-2722(-)
MQAQLKMAMRYCRVLVLLLLFPCANPWTIRPGLAIAGVKQDIFLGMTLNAGDCLRACKFYNHEEIRCYAFTYFRPGHAKYPFSCFGAERYSGQVLQDNMTVSGMFPQSSSHLVEVSWPIEGDSVYSRDDLYISITAHFDSEWMIRICEERQCSAEAVLGERSVGTFSIHDIRPGRHEFLVECRAKGAHEGFGECSKISFLYVPDLLTRMSQIAASLPVRDVETGAAEPFFAACGAMEDEKTPTIQLFVLASSTMVGTTKKHMTHVTAMMRDVQDLELNDRLALLITWNIGYALLQPASHYLIEQDGFFLVRKGILHDSSVPHQTSVVYMFLVEIENPRIPSFVRVLASAGMGFSSFRRDARALGLPVQETVTNCFYEVEMQDVQCKNLEEEIFNDKNQFILNEVECERHCCANFKCSIWLYHASYGCWQGSEKEYLCLESSGWIGKRRKLIVDVELLEFKTRRGDDARAPEREDAVEWMNNPSLVQKLEERVCSHVQDLTSSLSVPPRDHHIKSKIVVVTLASNRVDFVKMQHESLTSFLLDDFIYVVVNDGPTASVRNKIHTLCEGLRRQHHVLEFRTGAIHHVPYDAAIRCAETVNWIMKELVLKYWKNEVVLLLDNDFFLTGHFSVLDYIRGYDMAGILQDKPHACSPSTPPFHVGYHKPEGPPCTARYIWNAMVMMDMSRMPQAHLMDWMPGMVNGTMGDVGISLLNYFQRFPQLRIRSILGVNFPCVMPGSKSSWGLGGGQHDFFDDDEDEGEADQTDASVQQHRLHEFLPAELRAECERLASIGIGRKIVFQVWERVWFHFESSSNWWVGPKFYLSETNFSPEKLKLFTSWMSCRMSNQSSEFVPTDVLPAGTCPLPPQEIKPFLLSSPSPL